MIQSFKPHWNRLLLGAFALLLLTANVTPASAYGWDWDIRNFATTINVNKDSTINVTEHLEVDFSREQHHGIYRLIPVKYVDTNGRRSEIPISVLSVTDDNGKAWNYTVINEDEYINIKIGDPDVYVNEVVSYNINYRAERALGNYETHDEIYWNATGDKWEVPIHKAEATVILPEDVGKEKLKATCYTGGYGSTEKNCESEIIDGTTVKFTAFAPGRLSGAPALTSYQGLTIVAGYPKGIIAPTPPSPSEIFEKAPWYQKIYLFFIYNWGLLIPLAVGALMVYLWHQKGRDPHTGKTAIMPIYKPPEDLKPTEVGAIIDESVDIRDITSAIIDLAVRGYLKIIETKDKALFFNITNYKFELLKQDYQSDASLEEYEKKILDSIFEGGTERDLTDLNNEFYKHIPDIKKKTYAALVKKGYFPTDPDTIRATYATIGIVLLFGTVFFIGLLIELLHWSLVVGIALSGLIILISAKFMPARTLKGAETKWKILGLEEFIKTAERDRVKFQEQQNMFEKILPYAMTLGIAAKWTKAFEGIYKTPPSWYSSNDPHFATNFNTMYFLNSMNALSSSMSTTLQSSPRSSGSGFSGGSSGGGGGGGGGGAW
jgi:uncharacterized membrane protein